MKCYVLLRVFKSTNSGETFKGFKVLPSKPILKNIWDNMAPSFAQTLVSGVEIRYKILPSICTRIRCLKIVAIRSIHCVTFLRLNAFAERYLYIYKDYACMATLLSCTEICIPFDMI